MRSAIQPTITKERAEQTLKAICVAFDVTEGALKSADVSHEVGLARAALFWTLRQQGVRYRECASIVNRPATSAFYGCLRAETLARSSPDFVARITAAHRILNPKSAPQSYAD